jgi:hypothetical protein
MVVDVVGGDVAVVAVVTVAREIQTGSPSTSVGSRDGCTGTDLEDQSEGLLGSSEKRRFVWSVRS